MERTDPMATVQEHQTPVTPATPKSLGAALNLEASTPGQHDAVVWIFVAAGACAALAGQTDMLSPLAGFLLGGLAAFVAAGLILSAKS